MTYFDWQSHTPGECFLIAGQKGPFCYFFFYLGAILFGVEYSVGQALTGGLVLISLETNCRLWAIQVQIYPLNYLPQKTRTWVFHVLDKCIVMENVDEWPLFSFCTKS